MNLSKLLTNKNSNLGIEKYLYFAGALILFALKAVGLGEESIVFKVPMALALLLIFIKLVIEKHNIYEWLVILLLIGFGIHALIEMGSYGLLISLVLLLGCKSINRQHLFRILAIEYIICFCITAILALLGVRDGVVLVHEKFGMELTRRSLGYTHPNVLQITFVVLMALVLYGFDFHGKKLIRTMIVIVILDIIVFIFSLSFTGAIMSVALVGSWIYMEYVHYNNDKQFSKKESDILCATVPIIMFAPFVAAFVVRFDKDGLYIIANKIFNMRLWCINHYIDSQGITLFGSGDILEKAAIDCSYAYSLIRYGLIFTIIVYIAYFMTTRYLIKNNRYFDVAIMLTFVFAGMSEPFMFNASIKNLTIFMVGEWMYYEFEKVKKC